MQAHVAFVPSLVAFTGQKRPSPPGQVCIVVDVIRASTSLVTMVEQGASRIYIANDVASARYMGAGLGDVVRAGEEEGLAPEGFDYGNSPVELANAPLAGRSVVFVTTNGTTAIRAVKDAVTVLVGAMRNGGRVCREAWREAQSSGADLAIVCAGREGGFGIDDAYCAGYLVESLLRLGSLDLTDSAAAAVRLCRSDSDTKAVFSKSAAGENVIRLGLAHDVAFCAQRDVSDVVPRLGRELYLLEDARAASRQ